MYIDNLFMQKYAHISCQCTTMLPQKKVFSVYYTNKVFSTPPLGMFTRRLRDQLQADPSLAPALKTDQVFNSEGIFKWASEDRPLVNKELKTTGIICHKILNNLKCCSTLSSPFPSFLHTPKSVLYLISYFPLD